MHIYMYLSLILLSLDMLGCVEAVDRTKRDLLDREKDLFRDIKQRLTKLEESLDSRKCDGKPSQGITGGSHYTHKGGAAEYVCLPKDPEWGLSLEGVQYGGSMYGAEYYLHSNAFLHQSHNHYEVPCAVCEVTGRSKKIMIPGRKSCHKNWTKEYSGYLMSDYYSHPAPTEFICVDSKAKKMGKVKVDYGKLLFMVEAYCGSLPCPPYVHGKELTCVVCTK